MEYQDLIKTIESTTVKIIAIDGRCAAGKTTLAGKEAWCHPQLESYYDYKIFLDIVPEEQERRLTQRNPERVEMFQKMWILREES